MVQTRKAFDILGPRGVIVVSVATESTTNSNLALWFTHACPLDADTSMLDSPSRPRWQPGAERAGSDNS